MSTGIKRPLKTAQADAVAFQAMFAGCYERFEIAGSIRRKKSECGDCECCIIPRFETKIGGGLFAEPVNLLWERLDALVAGGKLVKHMYGTTGFRWGPLYRGVEFRGALHELYTSDDVGWGSTLAIRTGSAEFSQQLVTGLLRAGRRNKDGKVWKCGPCGDCREHGPSDKCPECGGRGLRPLEIIPVPTEEEFFELCGTKWVEPERR